MPNEKTIFQLLSTYEWFVDIQGSRRLVRIDIFKSINNDLFRARVWLQNIYNLYPALINTDASGNNLGLTHSADELNIDISTILADDDSYLLGKQCANEQEVIDYFMARLTTIGWLQI